MGMRKRDKITLPENVKKFTAGLKKRDKVALPEDKKKECMGIIHGASVACGGIGTGLAQIPLSDNAAITPIQIGMIVALGKVFNSYFPHEKVG